MPHEHHAGCGHHEHDHQLAAVMQQKLGQMCCSGQCNHIEHQASNYAQIAHQAEEAQRSSREQSATGQPRKIEKKKKRALRGFTLAGLFAATNPKTA